MAGQIRITPEQMRQRATEVRGQGQTFQEVIDKMQTIIYELQTEWEGAASKGFEAQFEQLKPSFNNMKQLIDDMGGQLDATANAVEQMDQEIANKFGV